MNSTALLLATILATASFTSNAAVRPHQKTIAIESPEMLPVLAQKAPAAMYLHEANDGRELLYIESGDGRAMTILDVTDPAEIRRIAQTAIPATTAFDFAEPVDEQATMIRYRDGSGVALLIFKHCKQPVLVASPVIDNAAISEPLGQTGLLVASGHSLHAVAPYPLTTPSNYRVVDTTNPMRPALLATITGVRQRLTKDDTGTLFLLNQDGVSVIRRLRVEEQYRNSMKGN